MDDSRNDSNKSTENSENSESHENTERSESNDSTDERNVYDMVGEFDPIQDEFFPLQRQIGEWEQIVKKFEEKANALEKLHLKITDLENDYSIKFEQLRQREIEIMFELNLTDKDTVN